MRIAAAEFNSGMQGQQQHANTAAHTVAKAPAKACSNHVQVHVELFLSLPRVVFGLPTVGFALPKKRNAYAFTYSNGVPNTLDRMCGH